MLRAMMRPQLYWWSEASPDLPGPAYKSSTDNTLTLANYMYSTLLYISSVVSVEQLLGMHSSVSAIAHRSRGEMEETLCREDQTKKGYRILCIAQPGLNVLAIYFSFVGTVIMTKNHVHKPLVPCP